MALWIDRYRPKILEDLEFGSDTVTRLQSLAERSDFPHLLVHGKSGAGKITRVYALLNKLYGEGAAKVKIEQSTFNAPSGKKIEISVLASIYHIEVNPSSVGIYDRVVIQELIKETAKTIQLHPGKQRRFKVIVIIDADKLTKEAQHALRRTMEKYAHSCRLILVAESLCAVISPVISRCLSLRFPLPTEEEVVSVLSKICVNENIDFSENLLIQISREANRNLRRSILMLQTCYRKKDLVTLDQEIMKPTWESYVTLMSQYIIKEQSSQQIIKVRKMLYDVMCKCIPPTCILKKLLKELLECCDDVLKVKVIKLAAEKEIGMKEGSKAIFHLESFVVNFMSGYNVYINDGLLDF